MFKAFRAQSRRHTKDIAAPLDKSGYHGRDSGDEDHHPGPTLSSPGNVSDPANGSPPAETVMESRTEPSLAADPLTVARQLDMAKRYAAETVPARRRESSASHDEIDDTLTVGRNIHLEGKIGSCETLVVQGKVEATSESRDLHIAEAGIYSGEIEVETAEIRGRFDGKLLARKRLVIHSSGRVSGTIRYGALRIDEGGEISGDIQVVNHTEKTAEDSSHEDADRSVAQPQEAARPPESADTASRDSSDFPDTAAIDAPPPIVGPLPMGGQFTQSHIRDASERTDAAAEQDEMPDPYTSDRTAGNPMLAAYRT